MLRCPHSLSFLLLAYLLRERRIALRFCNFNRKCHFWRPFRLAMFLDGYVCLRAAETLQTCATAVSYISTYCDATL